MRLITLTGALTALTMAGVVAQPAGAAAASASRFEAESHAGQRGTRIVTVATASGGRVVDRISDGDWLRYRDVTINRTQGTLLCFTTTAPTGTEVATVDIRLGGRRAVPVRSVVIRANLGPGQRQMALTGPIPDGTHTVYLTVRQPAPGPTFALDYVLLFDAPPPPSLNC